MTKIQKALRNEKIDKVPVWFMRQAGRYLPEYQEVKKGRDFMQMVLDPKIASEITLQPIERFDLDAAIIFSDILVLLHALDMDVSFNTGSPELGKTVSDSVQLNDLKKSYDKEILKKRLDYYRETIQITRKKLNSTKSLLGFAAAPFTLASYMVEGKTSKTHAKVRAWMHSDTRGFLELQDFIVKATIDYLDLQIDAGVDAIQLFDSWGDAMDTETYSTFIIPYIEKIAEVISKRVPVIFFCRGASIHRDALKRVYQHGVSMVSLDWRIPVDYFGELPVQGNLDPAMLFSNPETVRSEVSKILERRGHKKGFIFNLGHGIYPETPLENVEAMVETVKAFNV